MRILHVVYSLVPGRYRGGIPKIVYELAKAQALLGNAVTVLATDLNGRERVVATEASTVEPPGICLRYCRGSRWPVVRSKEMSNLLLSFVWEFDVLHGHNVFLPLNRYVARAGMVGRRPTFFHVHGSLDPVVVGRGLLKALKKRLYIQLFERKVLNKARAVFVNSVKERNDVRGWGVTAPCVVVPNGCDTVETRSPEMGLGFRDAWSIKRDALVVLYVGRINEKKALDKLLMAFGSVARECPRARLVVVGDRQQFPRYTRKLDWLVSTLGIDDRVIWTGFLDDCQKSCAFSAADVFCHVSLSEGMPMAALEALGMGLCVMVSPDCHLQEAVACKAAVEVQCDVSRMAAVMSMLLSDGEVRRKYAEAASSFARSRLSWTSVAQVCLDAYGPAGCDGS